jgi:hypothetical protein
VQSTALLLEHCPAEAAAALKISALPEDWLDSSPEDDRALLLLSLSNLLAPDCLREWFQHDPLVSQCRATIEMFTAAAFGPNNSLFARNELAIPTPVPPERLAIVVNSDTPREKWVWTQVKGLDYKVSPADVRPGDPDLELHFTLTWDQQALHFHADVLDTPVGFFPPTGRRSVELFIDPTRRGLVWGSRADFQFAFRPDGSAMEWFHKRPAQAKITSTKQGYLVDADIPWTELGLTPHPGMEFDATASVTAAGTTEWDPSLELSWRYFSRADDSFGLGTMRLE